MMHGCCAGDKTSWKGSRIDEAGERWHYNSAWFAARGYVVIAYTARGFVNGSNKGSTGQTQLDDRRFEINDYQYLAGLLADDAFFNVDPAKVVPTGGSYGGGFSWLALTDPTWKSPGNLDMKTAAAAPRYGWTDLLQSLVPNGNDRRDELPAAEAVLAIPGGGPAHTRGPGRRRADPLLGADRLPGAAARPLPRAPARDRRRRQRLRAQLDSVPRRSLIGSPARDLRLPRLSLP